MRACMCFLAFCVLAKGISSVAVMRNVSVAIGVLCALMHVAVACAFLLPVLPISKKGWIAGIITVHLLAGAYWGYVSPWFEQRLIDQFSTRMAHLEGHTELSDYLAFEADMAVIDFRIYLQRMEFPVSALTGLDVVWLVWLIAKTTAPGMSDAEMKPSEQSC